MERFIAGEIVTVAARTTLYSLLNETKFHMETITTSPIVAIYFDRMFEGHAHALLMGDRVMYVLEFDTIAIKRF